MRKLFYSPRTCARAGLRGGPRGFSLRMSNDGARALCPILRARGGGAPTNFVRSNSLDDWRCLASWSLYCAWLVWVSWWRHFHCGPPPREVKQALNIALSAYLDFLPLLSPPLSLAQKQWCKVLVASLPCIPTNLWTALSWSRWLVCAQHPAS